MILIVCAVQVVDGNPVPLLQANSPKQIQNPLVVLAPKPAQMEPDLQRVERAAAVKARQEPGGACKGVGGHKLRGHTESDIFDVASEREVFGASEQSEVGYKGACALEVEDEGRW